MRLNRNDESQHYEQWGVIDMKKNTLQWQTWLCILFGVATLATFFTKETAENDFFGMVTLVKISVYVLFIGFLLSIFRSSPKIDLRSNSIPIWTKRLVVILPILAIIFAIINVVFPAVSELLRMADNDIFQRPGTFFRTVFQLVSMGVFISLVPHFWKQKKWLGLGTLAVLALILFVMAGEEVSWGQRIFQWQTIGYFSAHNVQHETNLHNLFTQLFQNVLFFGGFLLLIILPFFHDKLASLLNKLKSIRYMRDFLPEPWMMVAFGAGLMFTDPLKTMYGVHWSSILFQLIATIMLLAALAYRLRGSDDTLRRATQTTLFAAVIVIGLSLAFNRLWLLNQGLPTEFLKLYISFGILCWALRVRERFLVPTNNAHK